MYYVINTIIHIKRFVKRGGEKVSPAPEMIQEGIPAAGGVIQYREGEERKAEETKWIKTERILTL